MTSARPGIGSLAPTRAGWVGREELTALPIALIERANPAPTPAARRSLDLLQRNPAASAGGSAAWTVPSGPRRMTGCGTRARRALRNPRPWGCWNGIAARDASSSRRVVADACSTASALTEHDGPVRELPTTGRDRDGNRSRRGDNGNEPSRSGGVADGRARTWAPIRNRRQPRRTSWNRWAWVSRSCRRGRRCRPPIPGAAEPEPGSASPPWSSSSRQPPRREERPPAGSCAVRHRLDRDAHQHRRRDIGTGPVPASAVVVVPLALPIPKPPAPGRPRMIRP